MGSVYRDISSLFFRRNLPQGDCGSDGWSALRLPAVHALYPPPPSPHHSTPGTLDSFDLHVTPLIVCPRPPVFGYLLLVISPWVVCHCRIISPGCLPLVARLWPLTRSEVVSRWPQHCGSVTLNYCHIMGAGQSGWLVRQSWSGTWWLICP